MINPIYSKKLGGYKIMKHTVNEVYWLKIKILGKRKHCFESKFSNLRYALILNQSDGFLFVHFLSVLDGAWDLFLLKVLNDLKK